jgi:hypothetical protein
MTTYNPTQLALVGSTPMTSQKKAESFFEAMAQAWGEALDRQADKIVEQSDALSGGDDSPQRVTQLTTESLRMTFLSNSSHTAISSVGSALETMARKQ